MSICKKRIVKPYIITHPIVNPNRSTEEKEQYFFISFLSFSNHGETNQDICSPGQYYAVAFIEHSEQLPAMVDMTGKIVTGEDWRRSQASSSLPEPFKQWCGNGHAGCPWGNSNRQAVCRQSAGSLQWTELRSENVSLLRWCRNSITSPMVHCSTDHLFGMSVLHGKSDTFMCT